jgi:hypothetical protein
MYLLRRGSACGFPLFKEAKKYRTYEMLDILLTSYLSAAKISRSSIFTGKFHEVNRQEIIDSIKNITSSRSSQVYNNAE